MQCDFRRRAFNGALVALAMTTTFGMALPGTAAAAGYPDKPIKLVVPYPPGGATDIIGRVIAQRMSTALGQQVIVDNRGGAGGNIGAAMVAKAAPDGYTLLMGALTSHSIMQTLESKTLNYNLEKDFARISLVGAVPLGFGVKPSRPVTPPSCGASAPWPPIRSGTTVTVPFGS